jgi:hypothetical protein
MHYFMQITIRCPNTAMGPLHNVEEMFINTHDLHFSDVTNKDRLQDFPPKILPVNTVKSKQ